LGASGVFLFVGLIGGVLKYRGIMASPNRQAPIYIDIAHRAALMYSFAALVMAELLKGNPWSNTVQLLISGVPLFFFAAAIAQYFKLGFANTTDNQYRENNFATTWGTWALIVGEVGGIGAIVWGFFLVHVL
jgi:hypothetical protein